VSAVTLTDAQRAWIAATIRRLRDGDRSTESLIAAELALRYLGGSA